jgi:cyclin H
MKLSEDDLYRTSTQFTHWSFTPQQLAAQRLKTNVQASERVKANVARQRAQRAQQAETDSISSGVENGSGANTPLDRGGDVKEVDCLTAEEEMTIVDEFCERATQLGTHCNFPTEVTVRWHCIPSRKSLPRLTIDRQHASSSCAASTCSTHP